LPGLICSVVLPSARCTVKGVASPGGRLAVPMCLLYEVGIIGAGWFRKASAQPDDAAQHSDPHKEA